MDGQVTVVPTQCALPSQASLYVQAFPSLQTVPAAAELDTVQVEVPLQVKVAQPLLGQVTVVPTQLPDPLQRSLYVQALPSSHADPAGSAPHGPHVPFKVLQGEFWQVPQVGGSDTQITARAGGASSQTMAMQSKVSRPLHLWQAVLAGAVPQEVKA